MALNRSVIEDLYDFDQEKKANEIAAKIGNFEISLQEIQGLDFLKTITPQTSLGKAYQVLQQRKKIESDYLSFKEKFSEFISNPRISTLSRKEIMKFITSNDEIQLTKDVRELIELKNKIEKLIQDTEKAIVILRNEGKVEEKRDTKDMADETKDEKKENVESETKYAAAQVRDEKKVAEDLRFHLTEFHRIYKPKYAKGVTSSQAYSALPEALDHYEQILTENLISSYIKLSESDLMTGIFLDNTISQLEEAVRRISDDAISFAKSNNPLDKRALDLLIRTADMGLYFAVANLMYSRDKAALVVSLTEQQKYTEAFLEKYGIKSYFSLISQNSQIIYDLAEAFFKQREYELAIKWYRIAINVFMEDSDLSKKDREKLIKSCAIKLYELACSPFLKPSQRDQSLLNVVAASTLVSNYKNREKINIGINLTDAINKKFNKLASERPAVVCDFLNKIKEQEFGLVLIYEKEFINKILLSLTAENRAIIASYLSYQKGENPELLREKIEIKKDIGKIVGEYIDPKTNIVEISRTIQEEQDQRAPAQIIRDAIIVLADNIFDDISDFLKETDRSTALIMQKIQNFCVELKNNPDMVHLETLKKTIEEIPNPILKIFHRRSSSLKTAWLKQTNDVIKEIKAIQSKPPAP